MDKNSDWRSNIVQKYSNKLGCKNTRICWCPICSSIDAIITEVLEHVKNNIDK